MRELLTLSRTAELLRALNEVFAKYSEGDLASLSRGYWHALRDLDREQVEGAVSLAVREEPRFPVPAKLREHAQRWVKHNRLEPVLVAREADGPAPICKHCQPTPRLAFLAGRSVSNKDAPAWEVKRYIAPCDLSRHPDGVGGVPYPANFLRWADDAETIAPVAAGRC